MAQLAFGISIPATLYELDPCGGSGQVVVQVARQVHRFAPFVLRVAYQPGPPRKPAVRPVSRARRPSRPPSYGGPCRPGAREARRARTASGRRRSVHQVVPHARRHDDRPVVPDVARLIDRVGPVPSQRTAITAVRVPPSWEGDDMEVKRFPLPITGSHLLMALLLLCSPFEISFP